MGRGQRRASVPRLRGDDDRRGVLNAATKTRKYEEDVRILFRVFVSSWLRFVTITMLHIPVLRWGQPYTSIEVDEVVHFADGEPIARVSRANGGLIQRDMRKASRARDVLREMPIAD